MKTVSIKKYTDTTLHDLKLFQDFLYHNFKDYKDSGKMRPVCNRPGRLYASVKTHKFHDITEINLDQVKFRPIMDQTGIYTYNASQVISNYFKAYALMNLVSKILYNSLNF